MRLSLSLLAAFAIVVAAYGSSLRADEIPDEQATAAEWRTQRVAEMEATVEGLTKDKFLAAKADDRAKVRQLAFEIKALKESIIRLQKKPLAQIAEQLAIEQANARLAAARKLEAARVAATRLREEEQAAMKAERAARDAETQRDAESGGCPLLIIYADFFHTNAERWRQACRLLEIPDELPSGTHGDVTILVCTVENRAEKPVEAYEVLARFSDGFDEIVKEFRLQGTLVKSGEKKRILASWSRIDTGVQVQVFVERTKVIDGQMWQRRPEHKQVSETVRKPRGADLGTE